jgi:hypothetical protein
MQKRNTFETPRSQEIKKRKNKILINKILFFLSVFVFIFIVLIFLSHLNKLEIKKVEVSGVKILDSREVSLQIENHINKKTYFFSKKNVFLYPKNKIKRILYQNPRIEKVNISRRDFDTLYVEIKERGNQYVWCGDFFVPENVESLDTECFFVDSSGVVMDRAPYFSGGIYLKLFGVLNESFLDSYDRKNKTKHKIFMQKDFGQIIYLYESLRTLDGVDIFAFEENAQNEIVFYLRPLKNNKKIPKIIFNKNDSFEKMLLNTEAIFNTNSFIEKFKNNYINFEYLDLRYGNKVYYKFNTGKNTPVLPDIKNPVNPPAELEPLPVLDNDIELEEIQTTNE